MMFEKVVNKYFDGVDEYKEDPDAKTVSFKVMWEEVNYDDLKAISLIMDTRLINFKGVRRTWGYCETCGGSEEYTLVECSGVRFEQSDPEHKECQIVKGEDVNLDE